MKKLKAFFVILALVILSPVLLIQALVASPRPSAVYFRLSWVASAIWKRFVV
ncbi:MAG: hypothetical protein J7576_18530 [Siphonobacter aquaeclarae]|nr:hypothetical protein [Siphonobacter aquaeclarae]